MKQISLYEFGASEDDVRKIQKPWVDYFRNFGPVLDIGCGRGVFLELLAAAGIEAVGVDHSEEALAACRRKGFQVHFEEACSFQRHSAAKFGGILCSHVIEHMAYDDAMIFLELCHQALRPGGRLLLITPNPEDLAVISEIFWLDPTHVRPYPKLLLKAMLGATGFQVIKEKQFLGSLKMIGRRNLPIYLLRRLILGRHYGKPNTLVLAKKNGNCQLK
ncbi:MAG TPA: class I SAM-dependent methyltransferase [Candidatus Acidoferrum sp.]|nr:class I SAM-dependent methyltransferase [Candidatus Acidoferrum sp.]